MAPTCLAACKSINKTSYYVSSLEALNHSYTTNLVSTCSGEIRNTPMSLPSDVDDPSMYIFHRASFSSFRVSIKNSARAWALIVVQGKIALFVRRVIG